ncbi:MAG TPA: SH3 domain-containing protein, partial [Candidatus Acidoferrales bacterium]|nr:SH3 domain-containing protein [Candidatus Acidoferrales bacterium]
MTPGRVVLRLLLVVIGLTMSLSVAVAQYAVLKADFVVSKPVINIFSKDSDASDVVSQALYGTGVTAVESKGEWILIRTADDYTGWVRSGDVQAIKSAYAPEGRVVRVSQLSANVYREPDVTKHAPLLNLP